MEAENTSLRPLPTDFDTFLPWACRQLSVESVVVITRRVQSDYVSVMASAKPKSKDRSKKQASVETSVTVVLDEEVVSSSLTDPNLESKCYLDTVYDRNLNLVEIKFLKNKAIPRTLFKIIALIIPFHQSLTSITINSGLHMEAIHEISSFLPLSQITELNFDNAFLSKANYHVLLNQNCLKHLSLSKCSINDAVVETIACKLVEPCPAARTLSALNLSTNRITDLGVKYLADALRTNRQLSYLNLADNLITDRGAINILNSLVDFCLTSQELKERKARYMIYLKNKNELINKTVAEIRDGSFDKKVSKNRKLIKPVVKKNKTVDNSIKSAENRSIMNVETGLVERAEAIVKGILGPFEDPFDLNNTQLKYGELYCLGNNSLCYLNLGYNGLTYFSLKKLHEVLLRQKFLERKPSGLINVMIDGNNLPENCEELVDIDNLLELRLSSTEKVGIKKKRTSKTGVRSN